MLPPSENSEAAAAATEGTEEGAPTVVLPPAPAAADGAAMQKDGSAPAAQVEEVRLAMGWNGGVSLAVWMGGVAVELDCARRAHRAVEADLVAPRRVYNGVCEVFRRRLVLDIFAGASAGGLNSALLGAAISTGRRLHPDFLRDRWLELGDLSTLLQPTNVSKPTSIMQGKLFADSVLASFTQLMEPPETVSAGKPDLCAPPVGQAPIAGWLPLLDIQATNVLGRQRGFVDAWGRELFEREYRAPFRFRTREDFTPANLAAAARASASFPAAFEPYPIEGSALDVAGLRSDPEAAWNKTLAKRPSVLRRYAIDGGLLENAPIRQAIDLIPSRPASGPVKRFVCYVNANPSSQDDDDPRPEQPDLSAVLMYVVNLPRVGRDIDQLDAIIAARRRGEKNADTLAALLATGHDELAATAKALFPAYRKRRAYGAYDDILANGGPVRVEVVEQLMAATHAGALLPWFPAAFHAPATGAQWNWGFRPAQRILHLQLDLLGRALKEGRKSENTDAITALVYERRPLIDCGIEEIEAAFRQFLDFAGLAASVAELRLAVDDPEKVADIINVLTAIYDNYRVDKLYQPLKQATESFYTTAAALAELGVFGDFRSLFDIRADAAVPAALSSSGLQYFLERALAIEVVRRAFVDDVDVDAAQTLNFAQLAPNAAARIFTNKPLRQTGPASGEEKLTGIRLGHFAGFYRRSWRANDYMWGRLDAATRIIDLLVDQDWQQRLPNDSKPWNQLAELLVPEGPDPGSSDQRQLVWETLEDARTATIANGVDKTVSEYLHRHPTPNPDQNGQLRQRLTEALKRDLTGSVNTRGYLTKVLLSRAAQYEILRSELPVLADQTEADHKLGASTQPFTWNTNGSLLTVINELRDYQGERALPARLGRDSGDELTSQLALRTVSHTALVALAALPGISMPLARVTTPGRLPFLAIAGIAARSLLANLAVLISFGAAAFYLTARIITADNTHRLEAAQADDSNHYFHPVLVGELRSPAVIAMALAALTVIGVLTVPALRAARSSKKIQNAAWALALLTSAGLIPIVCGWKHDGLAQTLTGSGGFKPNSTVLAILFAVLGIGVISIRQLPLTNLIQRFQDARSWGTSLLTLGAAALLLGWSTPHIIHALNDGNWHSWHTAAAIAALLSMPLLAAYAFTANTRRAGAAVRAWVKTRTKSTPT